MAIWTNRIALIPSVKLWKKYSQLPFSISEEDRENAKWWDEESSVSQVVSIADRLFEKSSYWTDEAKAWSDVKGENQLICLLEGDRVENLFFELDMRTDLSEMVAKIPVFAKLVGAQLYYDETYLIEPQTCRGIIESLKLSKGAKFVEAPIHYLREYGLHGNPITPITPEQTSGDEL